MSWEATTWALNTPLGGNAKIVLLGIANHAHPDGTHAFPAIETLAHYAHCSRSTVKRQVHALERDGWIVREGVGPQGTTCYRIPLERPLEGGVHSEPGGFIAVDPEPSLKTKDIHGDICVVGGSRGGTSTLRKADLTVPAASTPKALIERIAPVLDVLRRVHSERGGIEPSVRGASLALSAYPDRDHLSVASDLEHWMLAGNGQSQPCKDITRRYRTFLAHSAAGTAERPSRNGRPRNRSMREREALMDLV